MSLHPLPRRLHAGAWWLWALGLAVAASRTTNPVLLALLVAVAGYVVAARRSPTPWAKSFSAFLKLGLLVIGLRVVFQALFGTAIGGTTVLFRLPSLDLPGWAAGVRIGGAVTLEAADVGGVRRPAARRDACLCRRRQRTRGSPAVAALGARGVVRDWCRDGRRTFVRPSARRGRCARPRGPQVARALGERGEKLRPDSDARPRGFARACARPRRRYGRSRLRPRRGRPGFATTSDGGARRRGAGGGVRRRVRAARREPARLVRARPGPDRAGPGRGRLRCSRAGPASAPGTGPTRGAGRSGR